METIRLQRFIKNVRESPSLGEAMRKSGYSDEYSKKPYRLRETKQYKKVMEPILKQLEEERQRIVDELKLKDLNEEKYRDLIDGLDKLTKNIQLLGGKPTENNEINIKIVKEYGYNPTETV